MLRINASVWGVGPRLGLVTLILVIRGRPELFFLCVTYVI